MPSWLSLTIGTLLTIVPQIVTVVPSPYREIATGALALGTSLYHLFQPTPGNGR